MHESREDWDVRDGVNVSWIQEEQFGSAVPVMTAPDRLAGLHLTPQEGFVLSRVDGVASLDEICLVSGLPREETLAALAKLHEVGVIQVPGAPPPARDGGAGPSGPERRRSASGEGTDASEEAGRRSEDGMPPFTPDPECELPEEKQREIHDFFHRMGEMDFFQILGLERGCSGKDVQRAYRRISMRYHPDRFYGKKLGRTKALLEGIFRHLSNVADYLSDDAQRAAYEEEIAPTTPPDGHAAAGRGSGVPVAGAEDGAVADDSVRRRPARERQLTREDRLRRLGGVLGMSTQEIRAVARKRKRNEPEPDPEGRGAQRRRRRQTTTRQQILSPLIQRKQKAKRHFEEGVRAMLQGRWAAAASSLKLAVTFDPSNSEYQEKEQIASARAKEEAAKSYAKRAALEEGMGRFEEAARLYAMAADRHALITYLVKACEMLVHVGDLKQAVDYGKRATALDPNSVSARVALGAAYLAADMPKNARREVDYALKLDSDNRAAKRLLREARRRE